MKEEAEVWSVLETALNNSPCNVSFCNHGKQSRVKILPRRGQTLRLMSMGHKSQRMIYTGVSVHEPGQVSKWPVHKKMKGDERYSEWSNASKQVRYLAGPTQESVRTMVEGI